MMISAEQRKIEWDRSLGKDYVCPHAYKSVEKNVHLCRLDKCVMEDGECFRAAHDENNNFINYTMVLA